MNDDDEWEPAFLNKLVPILLDNPEVVLAFSDHYIIDEHGRIDLAATEENTRHWHRDVLSAGLHQPFWRCLLDMSIPVAQASVIRRDAIDWQDFPVEVGAAWDPWLGYLACRTGKACYYLPERLTRYRVHGGSVTATADEDGSLGMILIYARLMAMPELAGSRSEIEALMRCGASFVCPVPAASGTRARRSKASSRRNGRARVDAENRARVRAREPAGHAWRRDPAGAAPRTPAMAVNFVCSAEP